jgi:YggT family protein
VTATDQVLHWIGVLLQIYVLVLYARVIMSFVLQLTQYRPSGAAAVAFEFVYVLTDPPLRVLHRFVPNLTIGRMQVDVSFLVLLIGVQIVARQLI